ncbi:putative 1H-3-hydroxy-4-oxoquinaldine 2,4-dioxygenase [Sarocladium strictum]
MYLTKTLNGVEICYHQCGYTSSPPIVLMTGWAHDMHLYKQMVPILASNHRVIRFNWRGHSINRDYTSDFGVEEQVQDTIALLDALDVKEFYLVSHSHGGWPALELADRLGKDRVLTLLMIDQIMSPPPPEFKAGLQAMQDPKTWLTARQGLFENWLSGSNNANVKDHLIYSMGSFGHDMWSLSCRVIEDAYKTHTSPMHRMRAIANPPPIRHIFSHPLGSKEYRDLHVELEKEAEWFSWTDLKGETHFPSLEIPEKVCEQTEEMIALVE